MRSERDLRWSIRGLWLGLVVVIGIFIYSGCSYDSTSNWITSLVITNFFTLFYSSAARYLQAELDAVMKGKRVDNSLSTGG